MTSANNFDELPIEAKAQITTRLVALLEHMATFKDQLHITGLEAQFLTAGTRASTRDAQAAQAQAFTDLATTSATIDEIDRAIRYALDNDGLDPRIRDAFVDALLDRRLKVAGRS